MDTQTLPRRKQWIAILDYGSQYTQLIARRIREQEVYSEIVRCDTTAAELATDPPSGIILSGGPNSVFEDGAPTCDPALFESPHAIPRSSRWESPSSASATACSS